MLRQRVRQRVEYKVAYLAGTLYFITVCAVLQHNIVNVIFVSHCHLANANKNLIIIYINMERV